MAGRETRATRAAARARITVKVHEYRHDPAAASYGLEAAVALGRSPDQVLKTLIARAGEELVVCCVPVDAELDLKAVAAAAGAKKATLADLAEAERATGYVIGGISPIGQRRRLPTLVDEGALRHATICVSGGRRGLELELTPSDLLAMTGGRAVGIARRAQ
jgi:Cys-tRNA(Pro)/Cys-tRNA(Cys) deacylase